MFHHHFIKAIIANLGSQAAMFEGLFQLQLFPSLRSKFTLLAALASSVEQSPSRLPDCLPAAPKTMHAGLGDFVKFCHQLTFDNHPAQAALTWSDDLQVQE